MHQVKFDSKGKGDWFAIPSSQGWKVVFRKKNGGFPCVCSSGQHTRENSKEFSSGRSLWEHLRGATKGKVAGGEYIGDHVLIEYSVSNTFTYSRTQIELLIGCRTGRLGKESSKEASTSPVYP